ncbi:tRNA (uridine(54)-C5)-methyltransferase TrmA [Endozoicomonas sp. SM1973]|uniref:tRNA/tmRNA (uracil-C(5))-methyltransferase n=1 Tax=Spartinivicinus marinus TaxID=2994442 RepID=A0A853I2Y2_9GAMM|nr:tRNA (uridine(54)-C5)-methyltransferase TrmA [Spartinivicinus marinus]MCX4025667.1 tRNA (uridine(54)-C5)-methyltransferase TrmA [Spartinivicinus marinus]NYZ68310.1 tRNA (uridine(54)-C5)-methyltransferase TrmA [Spartinivicinus marinus]
MAVIDIDPKQYPQQLKEKAEQLSAAYADFNPPQLEIYPSLPQHYRMRAEFRIWRDNGRIHYAMFNPENKQVIEVTEFPVATLSISELMPKLLIALQAEEVLHKRLFQVEFLASQTGDVLVSLIYHKPLDASWEQAAKQLEQQLNIHIIGRSRKQRIVLSQDYVIEKLTIDEQNYFYQQIENSFTQPNAHVCEKMLSWATGIAEELSGDLLELYCGNGNFTVPLAKQFNKVLATEISKTSVKAAEYNFQRNNIKNVTIARMASEELTEALNNVRAFRRLAHVDLDDYQFSTVFVDPPRAGLDPATEELVKQFDNIIYISCNPTTQQQNITNLMDTHQVKRFALFDQFPYTHHMEAGVLLQKR